MDEPQENAATHESELNDLLDGLEVSPCPFCGEIATIFKHEYWASYMKMPAISYGVGCKTQECYGEQDIDNAYFKSPIEAAVKWNIRAPNSATSGQEERDGNA